MRVVYLTGDRVHIRPPVEADKECAVAWLNSPIPANEVRAAQFLEDQVFPYWEATEFTFIIARVADDAVIGSVHLSIGDWRIAVLRFHMARTLPDADELRADALRLLIPWLRDEFEFMTVRLAVPDNQPATITAAEELGMVLSARLREFVPVPGGRVDELTYEALNPRWEVPHA
ncbi:MAG TPA: GNAT family protein [Nitrolancea sp.]|nr:GNAT family protein [Nitrolancea sp.]